MSRSVRFAPQVLPIANVCAFKPIAEYVYNCLLFYWILFCDGLHCFCCPTQHCIALDCSVSEHRLTKWSSISQFIACEPYSLSSPTILVLFLFYSNFLFLFCFSVFCIVNPILKYIFWIWLNSSFFASIAFPLCSGCRRRGRPISLQLF